MIKSDAEIYKELERVLRATGDGRHTHNRSSYFRGRRPRAYPGRKRQQTV